MEKQQCGEGLGRGEWGGKWGKKETSLILQWYSYKTQQSGIGCVQNQGAMKSKRH